MLSQSVALGDKVDIAKKSLIAQRDVVYQSFVQEIHGKDEVVITSPIVGGKVIPLELDRTYYLSVYTDRGLYRSEGVVVNRSKEGHLYLSTIKLKTPMQKHQRRQFFRLSCLLNFYYKDIEKEIWQDGLIKDISGGGMKFISKQQLMQDEPIVCHLQLELLHEMKHLYVKGLIIDSIVHEIERDTFVTRVAFDDMPAEDREVIIKFIFEEERKRRKQEKGM